MASWERKVTKAMKGQMIPGEEVEIAVLLQPSGTMGQAAGGERLAENGASGTDFGLAGTVTNDATVLALTNERIVVMGYSYLGGKPKRVKSSLSYGDLTGVELVKQRTTYRFVAQFRDGTAKVFEAPRLNNDPEAFADAINRS